MKYPQLISMPSEISDWLEEQLEARGIDGVVYTRYILSLLHRDSADVICQDQDTQFNQCNKDLKRSRGGHKRFRRSSEWWGHSQADADQLKRSAAVECLLSASDQNCGIESLVDELCEKLKKFKNDSAAAIDTSNIISNRTLHDASPHDLARQYYAAFPALSHSSNKSPSTVLTFMSKCFTSPKKKGTRRRNRSSSCGEKLLYKKECDNIKSRTNGKLKFGSRNKSDFGCFGKAIESSDNCNLMFTKKIVNDEDKREKNETKKEKVPPTIKKIKQNDSVKNWDYRENEMYEGLPVDIIELLDSPSPHDYTVEMMNLANIREVGNKSFIHSGTNITSSIWSVDAVAEEPYFNENAQRYEYRENTESVLGVKFSSLSMDCNIPRNLWSFTEENKLLDTESKYPGLPFNRNSDSLQIKNHPWSLSADMKKWSEGECDQETNVLVKSLIKINHNRECSSFTEVCPKNPENRLLPENNTNLSSTKYASHFRKFYEEKNEENLLTSDTSHFKPINIKKEATETHATHQYADGTSFVISSSLEELDYKRSSSGYLYLESETDSPQRMLEFKNNGGKEKHEFVLKFLIKQHDKACQTDALELDNVAAMEVEVENAHVVPCKKRNISESEFYFPGDHDLLEEVKYTSLEEKSNDIWNYNQNDASPDNTMTEIMWKYDNEVCGRCNNGQWNSWILPEENKFAWQLDKDSLRNIWKGEEICTACSNGHNKLSSSDSHQIQLREDISQDGEQLLSDLSTLQKSYMEHLPVTEVSYDINELLTGANERKRRHSPVPPTKSAAPGGHRGSWSIASSIKQDHFMQMNSVPVLHSVTL